MRQWFILVVISLTFAAAVHAEPLDVKQVPSEARWLVHVDLDAATGTQAWKMVMKRLQAQPQYQNKVADLEGITGMQFPASLHDVTLFGKEFSEASAVLVIRANVDQERILGLLQLSPTYDSTPHGNYDIVTWEDKGRQMYGSFFSPTRVVISRSKESVQMALDGLDGKNPGLAEKSPLTEGAVPGLLAYIAGDGLNDLARKKAARSPMLNKVDSAWFALTEQKEAVMIRGNVLAKTPQVAQQLKSTAEGLKAMLSLAASSENPDPKAVIAADAVQTATVTVTESTVSLEWPIPLTILQKLVDKAMVPGTAPAE